jgi:Zn-dependent M28 family amino/carboxypeptidase
MNLPGLAWIGLILLGASFALAFPFLAQWFRPSMANALPAPQPAPIDGNRAYGYLKAICELGPRPAGSEANTRQRQMVAKHFKAHGATVTEQSFQARDPLSGKPVTMVNLVGSWFPDRTDRVVIGAHYDTPPHPDMETDLTRLHAPFKGANHGASGVALLMELAHHLNASPTPRGVDLVLFDGEELVYGRNAPIRGYFLGSKEFGRRYKESRRGGRSKTKYTAGIILDMVGGRNLDLPKEGFSVKLAPHLVREVWDVARALGDLAPAFRTEVRDPVYDDHLPLNEAGIPTIDIIDFSYPEWHTADDLPDRCSGASLAQVGRVVSAWLAQPKPSKKR